ncbi:Hypothetical predicted protein, partial [Marmota monax]
QLEFSQCVSSVAAQNKPTGNQAGVLRGRCQGEAAALGSCPPSASALMLWYWPSSLSEGCRARDSCCPHPFFLSVPLAQRSGVLSAVRRERGPGVWAGRLGAEKWFTAGRARLTPLTGLGVSAHTGLVQIYRWAREAPDLRAGEIQWHL